MDDLQIYPPALYVKHTGDEEKGHGAYAAKDFAAGDTVEVALVRFVWWPEVKEIKYYDERVYSWGDRLGKDPRIVAMAQGYGSQYNTDNNPNMTYFPRENPDRIVFKAIRDIAAGEELTIDYDERDDLPEIGAGEEIVLTQRRVSEEERSVPEPTTRPVVVRFEVESTTDGIAEVLMQEIHQAVENESPENVVGGYRPFLDKVAPRSENMGQWELLEDAFLSPWRRLQALHDLIAPHAKIRLQGGIEDKLNTKAADAM